MRRGVGVGQKVSDRIGRKVLRWFRIMERMSGELLTRRVYESEVVGVRNRGKPCPRWLDGDQRSYNAETLELSDVKMLCNGRE